MSDRPWVAPGSTPPPDQGPPPAYPAPPPPGYAAPPPGYTAPPPGYATPPPGYAAPPPGYATPPPGYAAPPPGYAGLEFRPGIIPLRPLALGDIFGGVTKAIRGNVAATMGLAVVTSLVCLVPATALGAWVASQESFTLDSETTGVYGAIGTYLPSLGSLVATIALTGFLAYVIGQAVLGRKVGIGETWDGTKRRLPALVGAVVLTMIGVVVIFGTLIGLPIAWLVSLGHAEAGPVTVLVLSLIASVPLYIFLWTRTAFVTAVIVIERRGVFAAFARSWRLTSGWQFWRIFGIRLLTAIIVGFAGWIITLPITVAGLALVVALGDESLLFLWQAVMSGVAALISGAITTPFSAGVDALMVVDQRIRREGLDVQLIHASATGGPPPWPSAAGAR